MSKRSGYIVKGHGRLEAAFLIDSAVVPVEYQDYDSKEAEHADMIADNKIAEFSSLDKELIEELITELNETDFDLELTGFDFEELDLFIEQNQKIISIENDNFSTEAPEEIRQSPQATTEATEKPTTGEKEDTPITCTESASKPTQTETEAETEPQINTTQTFQYKEQYGVIVMCADEAEQKAVYESLTEQGFNCKVVAT